MKQLHIYVTNHAFKKNQQRNSFIFQQPVAKRVLNLKIFGEIIVHLQKQMKKN